MLVCNVSLLRRRAAIAADVAEAAAALDAPGTGNIVFATLVDDPASVGDRVDAYLGEIMREAANAAATVTVNTIYAAAIVEAAAAIHTLSAFGSFTYTVAVVEPVTVIDLPSASISYTYSAAVVETATAIDTPSATVVAPAIYNVNVIEFTFADSTQDSTTPGSAGMFGRTVVVAGMSPTFVSPGSPNPTATVCRLGSGTALTLVKSVEVLGPTLTETAPASSTLVADVTGAAPIDHYELDAYNEYTPWLLTTGGSTYLVTVSGTWSGTMMLDIGIEGPPGTVTWYVTRPAFDIRTNGTYDLQAASWVRLRMALYVSGTALVYPP